MSGASEDVKWERVLWKSQPFPDNYVPRSFLSELRKNTNRPPYAYAPVVLASCAVTQHICTISIFLATFIHINIGHLDPRVLVWISFACSVGGYFIWEALSREALEVRKEQRVKAVKSSILVFLALLALSPVLKTLTEATSSDSIWALSAILFVLNALLADYGPSTTEAGQKTLPAVLSMNAAISASVVLASRLDSNLAVFALVLFAVQLFALFPIVRQRLQSTAPLMQGVITIMMSALGIASFVTLSSTVTFLVAATVVSTTLVCPAILVWAQKYKNEIRGPWDVAVPQVR